jgi:hypothetical protein
MVALPTSIVPYIVPRALIWFFFNDLLTTAEVVLPPIFHDRVLTAEKEMGLGLIIARAQRAHRIKGLVPFTDVPAMRLLVIVILHQYESALSSLLPSVVLYDHSGILVSPTGVAVTRYPYPL